MNHDVWSCEAPGVFKRELDFGLGCRGERVAVAVVTAWGELEARFGEVELDLVFDVVVVVFEVAVVDFEVLVACEAARSLA